MAERKGPKKFALSPLLLIALLSVFGIIIAVYYLWVNFIRQAGTEQGNAQNSFFGVPYEQVYITQTAKNRLETPKGWISFTSNSKNTSLKYPEIWSIREVDMRSDSFTETLLEFKSNDSLRGYLSVTKPKNSFSFGNIKGIDFTPRIYLNRIWYMEDNEIASYCREMTIGGDNGIYCSQDNLRNKGFYFLIEKNMRYINFYAGENEDTEIIQKVISSIEVN